jgi:hypothetical protein
MTLTAETAPGAAQMPAMAPAAVVGPAAQLILQHPMSVLLLAGLLVGAL